jgi:hypothetical protein
MRCSCCAKSCTVPVQVNPALQETATVKKQRGNTSNEIVTDADLVGVEKEEFRTLENHPGLALAPAWFVRALEDALAIALPPALATALAPINNYHDSMDHLQARIDNADGG